MVLKFDRRLWYIPYMGTTANSDLRHSVPKTLEYRAGAWEVVLCMPIHWMEKTSNSNDECVLISDIDIYIGNEEEPRWHSQFA